MNTLLPPFSPEELARYSRQLSLPGVGLEGQTKLRSARVLVVGLGGLGSPAAYYLAAAGVGTLGLAEHDRVEAHNLHRQILHDTASIGAEKIVSARERLAALNPNVTLREHAGGLTPANAAKMLSQYDIVLDGADNFPARYLANDAAFAARKPVVHGSIFQFEGQLSVFDPARGGPCYRCLFPQMPAPGTVPNCAEAGVFGALCGIIGSAMAMEALKLILGVGEPLLERLLVFDAINSVPRIVRLKRDPACPCCGVHSDPRIAALDPALYSWACETTVTTAPIRRRSSNTNERFLRELHALNSGKNPEQPLQPVPEPGKELPVEIDVESAHAWLESDKPPLVLDVREPFEVAICQLPGSVVIPMAQLHVHINDLPRDRPILIYCHHGGRSLHAAKMLRDKGIQAAVSMRGGIHDWAEQFDPAMPRY